MQSDVHKFMVTALATASSLSAFKSSDKGLGLTILLTATAIIGVAIMVSFIFTKIYIRFRR